MWNLDWVASHIRLNEKWNKSLTFWALGLVSLPINLAWKPGAPLRKQTALQPEERRAGAGSQRPTAASPAHPAPLWRGRITARAAPPRAAMPGLQLRGFPGAELGANPDLKALRGRLEQVPACLYGFIRAISAPGCYAHHNFFIM